MKRKTIRDEVKTSIEMYTTAKEFIKKKETMQQQQYRNALINFNINFIFAYSTEKKTSK